MVRLLLLTLLAHDYWVLPTPLHPEPGDTVICRILGGHHFPQGELSLSPRMVRLFRVVGPDGTEDTLEVAPDLTVRWVPHRPGAYFLVAELGPRRLPRPRSLLFAVVAVGKTEVFRLPPQVGELLSEGWPKVPGPLRFRPAHPAPVTLVTPKGEKRYRGKVLRLPLSRPGPVLLSFEEQVPYMSVLFEVRP